ncbi:hypothetical protein B0H11DRAFT_2141532 [Mycena galericulata]|nr:hypothetical protein B0H11DRAFT_2141532 [Mycena galericulata]
MQLASHGAQAFARNAPQSARSIHIPAAIRPQARGLGQRLLAQTRQALTQFVTHLTTPGTGTVSVSRSFHAVNPTIQQRLSFTARTTLARPVHPHFVPRGPMLPRTMTQVGLGTARNFTSGRPLFQQLADNIPIAGRAFYEADWELNMHKEKERENILRPKKRPAKTPASKELLKQTIKPTVAAAAAPDSEMEHYFPAPSIDVTTHLLIPLAPTPTARAPLPEFPAARLPLPALLAVHDAHDTHALRVASLFQRLDAADVWARGAACSAYASTAGPDGVCTVLRVAFAGWSKAAVRGVIGESGTGWCVLEEVRNDAYDADEEDAFSETSSILSGMGTPPEDAAHAMDPAQSFVLPTLDFSSSFLAASGSAPRAPDPFRRSNSNSNSSSGSGWGSAWDSDSDSSNRDAVFVDPPSENGWFESRSASRSASASEGNNPWLDSESDGGWHTLGLGFSSEFARRVAPEPFESAFA